MPFKVKHEAKMKNRIAKQAQTSSRTSGRKAPGTRVGLLFDWRGASSKSGTPSGPYGRSVRDGK
jgi:hypothetical protein